MDGQVQQQGFYRFGGFRMDPVSRTLTHEGVRVHLPARLFDTLLYLVQHPDRLVERDELSRAIWSTHEVSAGNLGRAISSLRIALRGVGAENLIVTAPGRGYRFGAPVTWETLESAALPDTEAPTTARPHRWKWEAVAALACAAALLLWRLASPLWPPAIFAPPPSSIAVLPFVNRGANRADTLYSDGIAQELINALGRIPGLKIAASTSSFQFRNTASTVPAIARQLNVGAVLEGSVRHEGTHLHIIADLVNGQNGFQIWSHAYDQDDGDMLAVQGRIAAAIVTTLKGTQAGADSAQLTLGGTTNPAAFDAYLRGEAALSPLDPAANRRAVGFFNQAVTEDPHYALAFARRARALTFIASYGNSPDVDYSHRVMQAALEDAQTAVRLAPELGAAHAELAFALQATLADLPRAEAEYRRAVALAPDDAATLLLYGRFALQMGHPQEGIEAAQQAVALDPLAARSHGTLAIMLAYARRYQDAKVEMRRAQVLRPNNPDWARVTEGLMDTLQGDMAAAGRVCAGNVDYRDMMCLAIASHALGRQAQAQSELAGARAALGDNGAFLYARVYAQWGQQEAALEWLRTAWRLHDPGLIEIKIDPALDPLRATPQYKELVREMAFPTD